MPSEGIPLKRTTVRAFLMAMSTEPRKELSMWMKAVRMLSCAGGDESDACVCVCVCVCVGGVVGRVADRGTGRQGVGDGMKEGVCAYAYSDAVDCGL